MAGIPFDPADQRVGRLEEAVQVLKGLFSDGPMIFAGRFYTLNGFEVSAFQNISKCVDCGENVRTPHGITRVWP